MENKGLKSVDFSKIEFGNPGCGGTQFAMLICALSLRNSGMAVRVYVQEEGTFPSNLQITKVESFKEALTSSINKDEILVYKPITSREDWIFQDGVNISNAKLVPWLHVTPSQAYLRRISKVPEIRAVVALGLNQYTRLRDNPIWRKVIVIPPHLVVSQSEVKESTVRNRNQVVFLGALTQAKGVHVLLDQWNYVRQKVPTATLAVIGSGNLYDETLNLGPMNIADKSYEKRIFKNFTNDGSVKFYGKVDVEEKIKIIQSSGIGVVNPTGETEVLCVSALEMQLLGTPVVARRKYGLRDSVADGISGLLYGRKHSLGRLIVMLMNSPQVQMNLSAQAPAAVNELIGNPTLKWIELLSKIRSSNGPLNFHCTGKGSPQIQFWFAKLNSHFVAKLMPFWPTLVELYWTFRRLLRDFIRR